MQEDSTAPNVPRVVIVGGGFGGFYATRALARAPVQITLVDKRNYHLFRPMLYQVATGASFRPMKLLRRYAWSLPDRRTSTWFCRK